MPSEQDVPAVGRAENDAEREVHEPQAGGELPEADELLAAREELEPRGDLGQVDQRQTDEEPERRPVGGVPEDERAQNRKCCKGERHERIRTSALRTR